VRGCLRFRDDLDALAGAPRPRQARALLAARIKAAGWRLDREPSETPWGDWAFAVADPDGYKITIIQE